MANKTVQNYSQWYLEATRFAAEDAFKKLCSSGIHEWWVWYKPQGLSFVVAVDKPEGYELVTGEKVPGDRTVEGITYWLRQYAGSVPVLPGD